MEQDSDFFKIGIGLLQSDAKIIVRIEMKAMMSLTKQTGDIYHYGLVIPSGVLVAECRENER